jgi:hypothetical protein
MSTLRTNSELQSNETRLPWQANPKDSTVRLFCHHLRHSDLKAMNVGGCNSHFSRKDCDLICQALQGNTSVTHVTVGWRMPPTVLLKTFNIITKLPDLQSLPLFVQTWCGVPNRSFGVF